MAEILSQQEIDQLLSSMKKGESEVAKASPEKEVTPFDFRLPNRISKVQLRTLRNIHENFAESLSSFLLSKLQAIVNINVISVDQIYYSEYVLSVSNPACLFPFEIKGTDIKGILEFSPELAWAIIDRLLGGSGGGSKPTQVITPIEQKVLFIIVEKIMQDLGKAWQVVGNYDFVVDRFESDIDFVQITSQSESVLVISFEIYIGEQSFLMNICFATYAFDTVLSKISSQKLSSIRPSKYGGLTAKEVLIHHLKDTIVELWVEFGKASISVKDLLELKVGDVIILDKKINEPVTVYHGSLPLFYGYPGSVENSKAVRIIGKAEKKDTIEK
jgi:flagellar motor switch protein FliM